MLRTHAPPFLILLLAVSTAAAQDEFAPIPRSPIDACPHIGGEFKIAPFLRVAQGLQVKGKEAAVEQLRRWAATGRHEDRVFVLCRMLFVARDKREFRRPRIGGAQFYGGTNYNDWPLEPIAIHKNVPILITYGYSLFGRPEPSKRYIDYCTKECDWSSAQFKVLDARTIAAVVDDWLLSREWPQELSKNDRAFFTKQAEQDGAGQPATAPESKTEGNESPKPESEARPQ